MLELRHQRSYKVTSIVSAFLIPMPRANRISCAGYVWHITHRCHQKEFLLGHIRDRQRWRDWLLEAKRRYGLSALNYIATSNHIHLLCLDQGHSEIPRSMQLVAGRIAQEFNSRTGRNGAFWNGRYHATAVQTDRHLVSCMTYIDLNMVRAGAVTHPAQWEISGYHEIHSQSAQQQVIDINVLLGLTGMNSRAALQELLSRSLEEQIRRSRRESRWTSSVAVGDEDFLRKLDYDLGHRLIRRRITRVSGSWCLKEQEPSYSSTA